MSFVFLKTAVRKYKILTSPRFLTLYFSAVIVLVMCETALLHQKQSVGSFQ